MKNKTYLCIDLKSFYASVECVERGLDPMKTNLVVADKDRGEKTITLAVSPPLKKLGIQSRCRIFEIPKNIKYIMAKPRMQKYIDYSAKIYGIYLKYISPDDIHVYSIDEVFIDVTDYLSLYKKTPKEMALFLMDNITKEVGVRATCGIGTNLYLAKIALDITAKHSPDFIGMLDEESFKKTLWEHTPLTDFWRIGIGTANRLKSMGITTMKQITETPQNLLYKKFGIDAELLIDHAFGKEPTTIADIHSYKPKNRCMTNGQILMRDYAFNEGKLILREMLELMCLDMVENNFLTKSVYIRISYSNKLKIKSARGTISLMQETNSHIDIIKAAEKLYEKIVDKSKTIHRVSICFNNLIKDNGVYQMSLVNSNDYEKMNKTRKVQQAIISIKKKYGKNAMLKGMNLQKSATTRQRNTLIGGHNSGTQQ